jgi:hypothetical protein
MMKEIIIILRVIIKEIFQDIIKTNFKSFIDIYFIIKDI